MHGKCMCLLYREAKQKNRTDATAVGVCKDETVFYSCSLSAVFLVRAPIFCADKIMVMGKFHKRSLQSLDFTVNRFFMKLFKTSNIEIVPYCQNMSGMRLSSVLLGSRYQKFLSDVPCDVYSWVVVVVSFFFGAYFVTLWWIKMNI